MLFAALALLLGTAAGSAVSGGPAVGERLPPFEARDQRGRLQSFETLRGPAGLLLVFFRSADW